MRIGVLGCLGAEPDSRSVAENRFTHQETHHIPLLSHSSRVRAFHSYSTRGDARSRVAIASQSCELRATACKKV